MHLVWWLFKVLEAIMGYTCAIVHIINVRSESPIPHVVVYCGTFLGFAIMASFQSVVVILNRGTNPINECVINATGAIMYFIAAILSLRHLQEDYELMYLSDFEEADHRFFVECILQSILASTTGLLYLLHCILAFDVVLVKRSNILDETDQGPQPLKLYFICPIIHERLMNYRWFQKFQSKGRPIKFRTAFRRSSRSTENFGDRARLKMAISTLSCNPERTTFQNKMRRTRSSGGFERHQQIIPESTIEEAATAIPLRDRY